MRRLVRWIRTHGVATHPGSSPGSEHPASSRTYTGADGYAMAPSLPDPTSPRVAARRTTPATRNALALAVLVLTTALTGCFRAERESGVAPRSALQEIASGKVGPGGATITADPNGSFPAVTLAIPAGAVDRETEVRVLLRFGDPQFPSAVQVFECEPRGLEFARPATLTIEYAEAYREATRSLWAEEDIRIWASDLDPRLDARLVSGGQPDVDRRALSATIDRLSRFYPIHAPLSELVYGTARLVDPAEPQAVRSVGGVIVADSASPQELSVGSGSLATFFASPPERNLLVVHGALGNAFTMGLPSSFAPPAAREAFNDDFENVVAFDYPPGRALAENGNALYSLLRRGATDERFGCNVIAHSTGGLVVRYALERAHLDESRADFRPDDPPLATLVDRVVMVGTPNLGTDELDGLFGDLLSVVAATDSRFVQGLLDAIPAPGGLIESLNRDWQQPDAGYFAIAGDVGSVQSDGIVDVLSVVGVPDPVGRPDAYQVFSGPTYSHASLAAFAGRTGVIDQARVWYGKARTNTRPIVGNLAAPVIESDAGAEWIRLDFAVSDAESDMCFVVVEVSIEGGPFFAATPQDRARQPIITSGQPAPGNTTSFLWNFRRDVPTSVIRPRVQFRVIASDPGGIGVPAISGRDRLP